MEPLFISLLLLIPILIFGTWLYYYLRLQRRSLSQLWIVRRTKSIAQNMSTPGKYIICIGIGILAEIGIPLSLFILAFALFSIHIEISQNFIFALALPFYCYGDLSTALPLSITLAIATLFQWPIYGWILGSGWVHHRLSKYAVILASFHIIAAVLAYWYSSKHPVDMYRGIKLG